MTQLSAAELFTPAPSGVGPFGNVPLLPASGTWLATMLSVGAFVQLPTTSWQSGGPERTIFAIESVMFSLSDAKISVMAQGGFLQTAASGTVTYTTVNGTTVTVPVTPDPSNTAQNPTGVLGWLDLLTESVYDVDRLSAVAATGPLAIVNTKPGSVGPYGPGTYHVGNTATGATYSNQSTTLTIPSSIIAGSGGTVSAVTPGLTTTIIATVGPHGLSVGSSVYLAIPVSSGISGLSNVFALVTATTTNTFSVAIGSSGFWTSGGAVYLCTVATMVADLAGSVGSAGPRSVTTTITQNAGVFCSNLIGWSGANFESNTALAARAVLSLAAASPNGPSQAYVYFAETAQQFLSEQSPPYTLTNGPVAASSFATPTTGIVTTVVASSTPASVSLGANVTPGVSQLGISGVSNSNPCIVTCVAATSLAPGQSMSVIISGVVGVTGVNGTTIGTYVSANSFSIQLDSTSAGAYVSGGSVEGGDLGQIDALLQRNVVPDNTTAITVSALSLPISIVATVAVPQANVATYQLAAPTQLQVQIRAYAVGGNPPAFEVLYDDIVGALEEAGVLALGQPSYASIQSLSINGGGVGVGVPFPSNQYQAVFANANISVVGV